MDCVCNICTLCWVYLHTIPLTWLSSKNTIVDQVEYGYYSNSLFFVSAVYTSTGNSSVQRRGRICEKLSRIYVRVYMIYVILMVAG